MSYAVTSKPAPLMRRILAGFLDLATAFGLSGYLVARFTGGLTDHGFNLEGAPALLCIALVIAYFVVFGRFLGGTLWQRILRTRPATRFP